jgi:LemA protein
MNSRPRWLVPVIVVGAILLLVVLPIVSSYNGLVDKDEGVDNAFAGIDTQLQRRNDLIPNLVGSVRAALNQEQKVFGDLARARQNYAGASTDAEKIEAGDEISRGIGRLLVIVENYPQLRSNENIQDLMTQLEGTENRLQQARREYSDVVTDYNRSIRKFPRSIVAGIFGFDKRPIFRATADARDVPTVDFESTTTTTAAG